MQTERRDEEIHGKTKAEKRKRATRDPSLRARVLVKTGPTRRNVEVEGYLRESPRKDVIR